MKYRSCFQLGLRNFYHNIKVYLNLVIVFLVFSLLSITLFSYNKIINNTIERYQREHQSENMITYRIDDWNKVNSVLTRIIGTENVNGIVLKNNTDKDIGYVGTDNTSLLIGNKKYNKTKMHPADTGKGIKLNNILSIGDFISQNEITEFQYRYPNDSILLIGDYPKKPGQILLSDTLMEEYGIEPTTYNDMIGNAISFSTTNSSGIQTTSSTYYISGIISHKFFDLNVYRVNAINTENILILVDEEGTKSKYILRVYVDECYHLVEVKDKLDKLIEIKGACNTLYSNNVEILLIQKSIMDTILKMVAIILSIAGLAYILNVYIYYFKEHHDFIKMMNALGMSYKKIRLILITELSLAGIIGAFIGSLVSINVTNLLLSKIASVGDIKYMKTKTGYFGAIMMSLVIIVLIIEFLVFVNIKSLKKKKLN